MPIDWPVCAVADGAPVVTAAAGDGAIGVVASALEAPSTWIDGDVELPPGAWLCRGRELGSVLPLCPDGLLLAGVDTGLDGGTLAELVPKTLMLVLGLDEVSVADDELVTVGGLVTVEVLVCVDELVTVGGPVTVEVLVCVDELVDGLVLDGGTDDELPGGVLVTEDVVGAPGTTQAFARICAPVVTPS